MTKKQSVPRRLLKYRAFNNLTLDIIIADNLYYADPSTFNDPLDTRPSLNNDLPVHDLERAIRQLIEQRINAEMKAAARTIRYKGPKTRDHIDRLRRLQADQVISEISYNANDPSYEMDNPHQFLLGRYLEKELLLEYEKGIVSLAERANCPLMWSHYGDQHHGVCIGYSVPCEVYDNLHRVKYGGKRLVDASKVLRMLDGDNDARRHVDEAVLFAKSDKLAVRARMAFDRAAQATRLPAGARRGNLRNALQRGREIRHHHRPGWQETTCALL
ncbi:DUF2971 domain-containing protein [Bradyrhizobium canariense]|uniref:DUF2971 domain-containing protein n=1 Tax=Bradyrhizobium canariense TaxID=255045 RepID=UPI001FED1B1D|nr:DUF2971 domain-containing protein [Bradyrhizobium canariense]